jgi:hypothetical protein
MAASDSTMFPVKGQAYRFYFVIRSSATGNPITGGLTSLAASVSKDGGSFASVAGTVAEIGTTGYGFVDLTNADTNADGYIVKVTAGNSNAVEVSIFVAPAHLGQYVGTAMSQTVKRLEQFITDVWSALWLKEFITKATGAAKRFLFGTTTVKATSTYTDNDTTVERTDFS